MSSEPNISDLKDCFVAPVSPLVNPTPMTVRNGRMRIVPIPPPPPPQIPSDGLRLYLDAANPLSYPGTGTTWTDMSPQGKTATLVNSPQFETTNGGEFNFVSASIQYATVTGTETSSALTMIAWIQPNGTQAAWAGVLFGRNSIANGLNYRGVTGQLGYHWNSLNSSYDFISGLAIPANQWSMVAVAVQPSQAKLYLGSAGTLSSSTNAIPHTSTTLESLNVGRDAEGYRNFNGRIGAAIVYNRALSDAEMQQVYTALQVR